MNKILLLIGVLAMASPALSEIYTWTSPDGVVHLSNTQTKGRALPGIKYDAGAERSRREAEAQRRELDARERELTAREGALAAEQAALYQAQPPVPPVTAINRTIYAPVPVVIYPAKRHPYRWNLDKYRGSMRLQWGKHPAQQWKHSRFPSRKISPHKVRHRSR